MSRRRRDKTCSRPAILELLESRQLLTVNPFFEPDFSTASITAYDAAQDYGTTTVETNYFGRQLQLNGNAWKKIPCNYAVASNTWIEFDFRSTSIGEVGGIGFDADNTASTDRFFKLYGSQNVGISSGVTPYVYNGDTPWVHYKINVGSYFTGTMNYLTFIGDNDVGSPANVEQFRWIKIYDKTAPTVVNVNTSSALNSAISNATPGTEIVVAPGTYSGGGYWTNKQGTGQAPIVIRGSDPNNRPIISGGGTGWHFVDAKFLEIRDMVFTGASEDGINIDDGGTYATPADHITFDHILVKDNGTGGNQDAIKLSGVDNFLVINSTFQNWSNGGSAIDMCGCHRAFISFNTFINTDVKGATGPQMKAGSNNIVVDYNYFNHAGVRPIQIGGTSDFGAFRPQPHANYEAKDITAERNVFNGGACAVAFVGIDGSTVRFNTMYRQKGYVFRILQENTDPSMVQCRNGVITDNIITWYQGDIYGQVNIGSNTLPATFSFARNWWYNYTGGSTPSLPSVEQNGVYGVNPLFVDAANANFHLQPTSTAGNYGRHKGVMSVGFAADKASGNESTASVSIPVTLPYAANAVATVQYAVTGGTASNGTDYVLNAGTLTYQIGVTSQNINFTVTNDTAGEADETLVVTLSNPVNVALGAIASHTYTIVDNDPWYNTTDKWVHYRLENLATAINPNSRTYHELASYYHPTNSNAQGGSFLTKAQFEALSNHKVVTYNGIATGSGAPFAATLSYTRAEYATGKRVDFNKDSYFGASTGYNFGSYTSNGRLATSGPNAYDLAGLSALDMYPEADRRWVCGAWTVSMVNNTDFASTDHLRSIGFMLTTATTDWLKAPKLIVKLEDLGGGNAVYATLEYYNASYMKDGYSYLGSTNVNYAFFGYQAPANKKITAIRIDRAHTDTNNYKTPAMDDLAFQWAS